jgi:hypothetical protein
MKKLLVTFLLIILSFVTYSQSGVGYVNYTSYKLFNGTGTTNQYAQFPYSAAEFDNMLNTSNSNTTITHSGEVTLATMCNGSTGTPHWASDFYAIKFEFWFIPTQTGTYRFGVNSDDASDLSVDGTIITTYYGGHGASGYQYGSTNMVAGTTYKIVVRYQEYGGGDALFVNWSRPSAPNSYSYWNEEVTNKPNNPTKKAVANFYLNQNINATTFAVSSLGLSSAGSVNITNLLDSNKIATGNKAIIAVSNWESVIINPYESNIGGHRLLLDERMFSSTSPKFNTINSIKVLDIYDGPVNIYDTTGWWKTYIIPTNVATKITASIYQNSLRLQDGWYAIQAGTNISYTPTTAYSPQSISVTTTNNLTTLYNSIVTVSDVYLAFKELANGGIFGNQSGNEFGYGIQYKNADVNDDGYFNEKDCFALLQNLTGVKTLVDTFNLNKTMRIIPQLKYDSIGKSNWTVFTTPLGSSYSFDINTGKSTDTINLAVAWKGDVNLSHSTTPKSNNLTTMSIRGVMSISTDINASIMTEIIGDSIYAYITLDPLQQNVVGTQFQLNYDNSVLKFKGIQFTTKGSPTNYATDKGDYINLGSLISDGSTSLDNTTSYKISFSSNTKLDNILGLISIGSTDAVNQNGKSLKVKIN